MLKKDKQIYISLLLLISSIGILVYIMQWPIIFKTNIPILSHFNFQILILLQPIIILICYRINFFYRTMTIFIYTIILTLVLLNFYESFNSFQTDVLVQMKLNKIYFFSLTGQYTTTELINYATPFLNSSYSPEKIIEIVTQANYTTGNFKQFQADIANYVLPQQSTEMAKSITYIKALFIINVTILILLKMYL